MAYTSPPALPRELWGYIESHLSNADIKSLRLACKQFNNAVFLRLNRVFLSANPLNIEVFRNIASHDTFRHQINEIIWDEARLSRGPARTDETNEGHELLSDEDEPDNDREWVAGYHTQYREVITGRHESEEDESEEDESEEDESEEDEFEEDESEEDDGPGCPRWFEKVCGLNFYVLESRERRDVDGPGRIARWEQVFDQPSLKEPWQHYLRLLRQQKDVLACQTDLEAFAFGVKRFPALKRVTITPAAHGNLTTPLYPTPMIRAFPKGFNYPIPRGWLYPRANLEPATPYTWNQYPELRDRYRGFRTAMRVLANAPNSVSELVMTSNSIPTGINCTIFDEPCEEYNHFATVLKKPGFRRLDIALLLGGRREEDREVCWRSLLNGRLRLALGEAKETEEFRLHASFDIMTFDVGFYPDGKPPPLQSIVPVEQWSKLRHFELAGFAISQGDCVSFLKTLPKSVRSIELSMLEFFGGGWYSMLEEIKRMVSESTLWGDRDAGSRPKITIGVPLADTSPTYGHGIWIEKEVEDFIYGEGENPFRKHSRNSIQSGVGVMRDALEPDFEHPYHDYMSNGGYFETDEYLQERYPNEGCIGARF
ncbi:uncharacterized protein N7515_001450 [Penicillium bovifimosum]|uniref:F-box domain-containing protein n=1 Tax=Penicillium bovifimosum TaxID=126998 RepID=A0A9W9HA02_9EURO|nr:uncharacterized protein N7515_001450 [Penicillium bovifimosum]KAJ5142663.1 hypothetical protein N7515_001450 [Penicillium bovifimosum]